MIRFKEQERITQKWAPVLGPMIRFKEQERITQKWAPVLGTARMLVGILKRHKKARMLVGILKR